MQYKYIIIPIFANLDKFGIPSYSSKNHLLLLKINEMCGIILLHVNTVTKFNYSI